MVKHFVILGYGLTGRSILNFLIKKYNKLQISIYEEKILSKKALEDLESLNVTINICNNFESVKKNIHNLNRCDLVITSPGIKPEKFQLLLKDYKVVSDLELFSEEIREDSNKVFAITGTNGKSTVCQLLGYLLENYNKSNKKHDINTAVAVGGNYGVPVLDFLDYSDKQKYYSDYVLELSSYQLALTEHFSSLAAVCLNISVDHLDWHGTYYQYIFDKLKIYRNSSYNIVNLDQESLLNYYKQYINSNRIGYTLLNYNKLNYNNLADQKLLAVFNIQDNVICLNNNKIISVSDLPDVLQARHNLSNFLAVLGLLYAKYLYNKSLNSIDEPVVNYLKLYLTNIANYKGLPHRCQLIAEHQNIQVINDSKSTNLDATLTAINSIKIKNKGRIWLILGGLIKEDVDDKASQDLFLSSLDNKIAEVIVFGKSPEMRLKLLNLVKNKQGITEITETNGELALAKIIKDIFSKAQPNDTILFSPGCASFDMFNNYIHRGEMFCRKIEEYVSNN
ncbi:MAG: UDP-N-acetylmuramoyl-L-alanine--D-glutamate ligase [Gammaproteobacteria bacterium]|nr:UDP-N-acetylmuramoyl-L-alanine--D-glutamate ligase [Gammaproteobacteria bacterium]